VSLGQTGAAMLASSRLNGSVEFWIVQLRAPRTQNRSVATHGREGAILGRDAGLHILVKRELSEVSFDGGTRASRMDGPRETRADRVTAFCAEPGR
jgi:hypothetical protein